MLDDATAADVQDRLARIAGQVGGLVRMVEERRYCVDVLLQIAAVQAALGKVGQKVLANHVSTCVAQAMASGDPAASQRKVEELMQVFERFGQLRPR